MSLFGFTTNTQIACRLHIFDLLKYCEAATLARPASGHLLQLDDMAKLARRPLPPLEVLDELFEVDETSPSGLRRRKSVSQNTKEGDIAGTKNQGYWKVKIRHEGKTFLYLAHRIVYAMNTRKNIDEVLIDHIGGANKGNEPRNLREASRSQNARNRVKKDSKCSSKYLGVCWHKSTSKWMARLVHNNTSIYLGVYTSEIDAALAYNEAALRYHGEFANLNDLSV